MGKRELNEIAKRLVQDLAMKFAEAYKVQMRNHETTREEDIQTAFVFGFAGGIKHARKDVQDYIRMYMDYLDEPDNSEGEKEIIKVLINAITEIDDSLSRVDYMHSNSNNKDLN